MSWYFYKKCYDCDETKYRRERRKKSFRRAYSMLPRALSRSEKDMVLRRACMDWAHCGTNRRIPYASQIGRIRLPGMRSNVPSRDTGAMEVVPEPGPFQVLRRHEIPVPGVGVGTPGLGVVTLYRGSDSIPAPRGLPMQVSRVNSRRVYQTPGVNEMDLVEFNDNRVVGGKSSGLNDVGGMIKRGRILENSVGDKSVGLNSEFDRNLRTRNYGEYTGPEDLSQVMEIENDSDRPLLMNGDPVESSAVPVLENGPAEYEFRQPHRHLRIGNG